MVPVPQALLAGTTADKWVEEKDSADLELEAVFRSVQLILKNTNAMPNVNCLLTECFLDKVPTNKR